jgi:hypothetical protein
MTITKTLALAGSSQASAWGFNYREWDRHLNLLTWPEILRQFSLAAGYGPSWKHQQADVMSTHCIEEGHYVHQKVSTETL